jgi:hypothetical protein
LAGVGCCSVLVMGAADGAAVPLAVGGLLLIGAAALARWRRNLPGVLIGWARLVGFQLLGPRRRGRA